ncbi:hypothetical protein DV736_g4436, partial [Chaetothyriales sp. CBS 134916]
MPKRTLFTNITPLPPEVSREVAVAMLHNHDEMIELNPLVIEHHPIKTPRDAPADEFLDCVWQELTDKIHYLPRGIVKGKVSYQACFHDLPRGLQTHIYAPMGLDIREKWSICGSLPGELPEARELGLDAPTSGLYLREDGDMRCPRFLTSFVHKNLNNAHKVLVERILKKAQRIERHREALATAHSDGGDDQTGPPLPPLPITPSGSVTEFQAGSHMAKSRIIHSPELNIQLPPQSPGHHQHQQLPQPAPNIMDHPAFRPSYQPSTLHSQHNHTWSSHTSSNNTLTSDYPQPVNAYPQPNASLPATKQFLVELPGSLDVEPPRATTSSSSSAPAQRQSQSGVSELSSNGSSRRRRQVSPDSLTLPNQSDRGSTSGTSDRSPSVNAASSDRSDSHGHVPIVYVYNPQDFSSHQQYTDDIAKRANHTVYPS